MSVSVVEERALKKKFICVRFTQRNDAIDAVSDIIVLNRNKRPPRGYTTAGDVDGAHIAFHVAPIASTYGVTQNKPAAASTCVFFTSFFLMPKVRWF